MVNSFDHKQCFNDLCAFNVATKTENYLHYQQNESATDYTLNLCVFLELIRTCKIKNREIMCSTK